MSSVNSIQKQNKNLNIINQITMKTTETSVWLPYFPLSGRRHSLSCSKGVIQCSQLIFTFKLVDQSKAMGKGRLQGTSGCSNTPPPLLFGGEFRNFVNKIIDIGPKLSPFFKSKH